MAARGETQANVEVSTLVVPAWRLRWRAPELALVLGERALALASARHDEADRLRAESLVVFAGNRVDRGVRVADRAIDALKAAEAAGELETAWLLRVELAACARSVGAPLTGFAAVTPVLEARDVPAELRASALVQASECLVTVGRGDEPTRALAEADQLYVADKTLDDDTRLLLRGLIRAVQAAQHRRWGDLAAAIGAAREGIDLLSRFSDPSADSGLGMGRLTLELVLALMDANRLLDACEVGGPVLDRPVRAPSASTTGWLRLALATRVHLPAGRVALAREMLREAAASAERHQLDTLLAESLLALAHVHEVSGELADALTNLRSAHAAERRRARAVYAVRARLAAEFSGVHRQPADLHQQLARVLRPVEGMPLVTDGVLSAALKQQLRQWRPVQVRKGDGLSVKRVRRAAEDMTVEGLSAARQHAADRWRMVQPFGEPDDKTPEPVEPPPATPSSDRTVPASGLIASAGAMVSGRRRAARVAAGEIDDDEPNTLAETPAAPEPQAAEPQPSQDLQPEASSASQPPLSPEQERKRKVEQQLMELQREARRQIEAERQAREEQRAQAEREAREAEEAARQEAARQEAARAEAARQEAARQEAARQEAVRQETARQEAARQETARLEAVRLEEARREAARLEAVRRDVARQEAAHQEVARQAAEREEAARAEAAARAETSNSQPESVLDMLKAQGLRAGGRRRARDSEAEPATPSWRVEPPSRLREDDAAAQDSAGSHAAPNDHPNYFPDPASPDMPDRPGRSGLAAAFGRPPAAPDFGPHLDDPAYPLHTPATGIPATPADPDDERKLPDLDFSSLDFGTPKSQRQSASVPSPEPAEHADPIPSTPTPDEIPQAPEPDLLSSTFLSSADVEDDTGDVPTVPVRLPRNADQPAAPDNTGQPGFGSQPSFGTQNFGTQPTFGTQPGFATPLGFGGFGIQSGAATPGTASDAGSGVGAEPDTTPQYDYFATEPEPATPSEPLAQVSPMDAPTETGLTIPAENDPAGKPTGESGTRTGRPSSRRRPSDLSLADLLAEALVAYETGRRSDEEQVEATDLSVPDLSAAEAGAASDSALSPERSGTEDPLLRPGESFGSQPFSTHSPVEAATSDSSGPGFGSSSVTGEPGEDLGFRPGSSFGAQAVAAEEPGGNAGFRLGSRSGEDSEFGPGSSFGSQSGEGSGAGSSFGSQPESGESSGFGSGQPFGSPSARAESGDVSGFQPGSSFGTSASPGESGTDPLFRPGSSFGSHQDPAAGSPIADSIYSSTPSFGTQQSPAEPAGDSPLSSFGTQPSSAGEGPRSEYFLPAQPYTSPAGEPGAQPGPESAQPLAETEQEKTGPIAPVGAAPDSETTGPIRPVGLHGPAGWTLPGA